jgi:hypothetical protein
MCDLWFNIQLLQYHTIVSIVRQTKSCQRTWISVCRHRGKDNPLRERDLHPFKEVAHLVDNDGTGYSFDDGGLYGRIRAGHALVTGI